MKKSTFIIIILPLILLSLGGLIVNGIYYYQSFTQSGYWSILAMLMLVCFLGMEYVLYLYHMKKWYLKILKVSIIIFSILITLSAQFFATSQDEVKFKKILNNSNIYIQQIEDNRKEMTNLNERINKYAAQHWVNTKQAREDAQNRIDFLSAENKELYKLITDEESVIEIAKSTYTYYAEKIKWQSEDVRIIFQLISSVLLALISPVSLSLIRFLKDQNIKLAKDKQYVTPEKKVIKKITIAEPKKDNTKKIKKVKQILQMLLLKFYETKSVMEPQKAYDEFQKLIKKKVVNVMDHDLESIQEVYNLIYRKKLHKSNDIENINKGVLNEYQ